MNVVARWLVTHPLLSGLALWPLIAVTLVGSAALLATGNPIEDKNGALFFWATGIASALLTAASYSRHPGARWAAGIGLALLSAGIAYGLTFGLLVFAWFGTDCFGRLSCPTY